MMTARVFELYKEFILGVTEAGPMVSCSALQAACERLVEMEAKCEAYRNPQVFGHGYPSPPPSEDKSK